MVWLRMNHRIPRSLAVSLVVKKYLPLTHLAALGAFAALMLPAIVLLAHVALLPQGQWHDEYFGFVFWRLYGFDGELMRLLHWGPRPLSELFLYFYYLAEKATNAPLLVPALAFAWSTLGAGLVMATRPWRRPGRAGRAALALSLPALFLMVGPIGELFYWPYGALAYLPALGAACFVTLHLAGPGLDEEGGWTSLAVALALGAISVEMGAFLTVSIAPGLLLVAFRLSAARRWQRITAVLVPLAMASGVLFALWNGRVSRGREMFGNPALVHHVGIDFLLAVRTLALEFIHPPGWSVGASLAAKVAVFFGARACLAAAWPGQRRRGPVYALLVGLTATALLSILGAYYNFGVLCCDRHETYRQALYLLMVVAAAGLWKPAGVMFGADLLLPLAVLINLQPRLAAVRAEYRLAGARAYAWHILFASGLTPGPGKLDFVVAPSGPLFQYGIFPPGFYQMSQHPPTNISGPMLLFNKQSMQVREGKP